MGTVCNLGKDMEHELKIEMALLKQSQANIIAELKKLNAKLFDNGLLMAVHDNTKFRKLFKTWLITMWGVIMGIISWLIKESIR